jgi:tetratricopeptide (TPR) repeat protein
MSGRFVAIRGRYPALMAAARDDRNRKRRRPPQGRRGGGFGPWGPPRPAERERRPDEPSRRPPRTPARYRVTGQRHIDRRPTAPARRRAPASTRQRGHRRRRVSEEVEREILGRAGRRGDRLLARLFEAAEDFDHERDRRAARTLRELRDELPDAPSIRELLGLAQYRLGNYRSAAKELEAFVELSGSVEQHPVLMDCYRAQHRWGKVEQLWQELAAASPSAQLVAEGRIVAAGALADQGRVAEAIGVLSRKAGAVKRPRDHHLRLWYALADLEERAGDHARARDLFARVAAHDPRFADVTARRAALG